MDDGYRRLVPFALVAACVPLLFAWATTISTNCPLGDPAPYCNVAGINRSFAFSALALPAGLLGGLVGWIVPDTKIDGLAARPRLGPVFRPPDRTLVALGLLVPVSAAFAPFLFFGTVTSQFSVWALLALPYYPGIGLLGVLVWLSETPLPSALPYPVVITLIVCLFLVGACVQVAWFYLLASALGRLGSAVTGSLSLGRREVGE